MNNKEIEYYEFRYKIPKYKIKPPLDFSKYYEIHKDEIIIDLHQENKQLKDKISKIETLIINHNCDTGDIYYKYNSKFLKSELKQRILEIVYEQGSDSNE